MVIGCVVLMQENNHIQNNIHRRQVKHDTAMFLRQKYLIILQTLKDVRSFTYTQLLSSCCLCELGEAPSQMLSG